MSPISWDIAALTALTRFYNITTRKQEKALHLPESQVLPYSHIFGRNPVGHPNRLPG